MSAPSDCWKACGCLANPLHNFRCALCVSFCCVNGSNLEVGVSSWWELTCFCLPRLHVATAAAFLEAEMGAEVRSQSLEQIQGEARTDKLRNIRGPGAEVLSPEGKRGLQLKDGLEGRCPVLLTLSTSSPSTTASSALLPRGGVGPTFPSAEWARDRASSPALMTLGQVSPTAAGGAG